MSNKPYQATEQTVQAAIQFIRKSPAFNNITKFALVKLLSIIFNFDIDIYRPGDTVYLAKKGSNIPADPYLVCMTGDYKGKLSIRFCNTFTGVRAGHGHGNKQAYQLPDGVEGITSAQIEEYLNHEYIVVSRKQ
mgnify:CR=1 FL=1